MDIKIAKDFYVPKENILYYRSFAGNAVFNIVKRCKAEGRVIDATGNKKTASVIFLKDGSLILTPVAVDTIHARCEEDITERFR